MGVTRREFVRHAAAVGATVGVGVWAVGAGSRSADDATLPLRPPGSVPEEEFVARCIRCLRCVDVCPNQALVPMPLNAPGGRGGTPTMHPRKAACMLCSGAEGDTLKCTEVCPSGALSLVHKEREEVLEKVAIGVAEIDFDLCYSYNHWSCGACFRACPLAGAAMTVGAWERPTVHADACVGCGCCERSCIRYPHAIRVRRRA